MHKILRPLSIHEASFPVYGQLSPGGGNIVSCLHVHGPLTAEACEQSLQHLMSTQQGLQVGVQWFKKNEIPWKKPGYAFVQLNDAMPSFSVSKIEEESYNVKVAERCHALLNQPFEDGHLLWRAHLLSDHKNNNHTLFICINHCISDGASVTTMLTQWLAHMHRDRKHNLKATALKGLAEPLWASMPKKMAHFLGAFKSLDVLPVFIKGQKLADHGLNFESGCNVPAQEHRCLCTHRTLTKAHSQQLISHSKQLNKRVHGLISASLIQALLAQCEQDNRLQGLKKRFEIPFVSSVDMRNKLEPHQQRAVSDETALGCLSSGVVSKVKVDLDKIPQSYDQNPWQLGDQVSQGIVSAFKQHQHWKVLRFYQVVGLKGLKKMFMDASEKPLATPLSLANLGSVNFKQNGSEPLTVKGYEVYAAFHASGAGVNVTANTVNGALTLCFTCPSPAMSQLHLEAYAQKVLQTLEQWSDSGSHHSLNKDLMLKHA